MLLASFRNLSRLDTVLLNAVCPILLRYTRNVLVIVFLARTLIAAHNPHLEDAVAAVFVQTRVDARLPKLERIRNRPEIQQLTCTAASLDKAHKSYPLIFKTAEPLIPTSDVQKLAVSKGINTRFAKPFGQPARKLQRGRSTGSEWAFILAQLGSYSPTP